MNTILLCLLAVQAATAALTISGGATIGDQSVQGSNRELVSSQRRPPPIVSERFFFGFGPGRRPPPPPPPGGRRGPPPPPGPFGRGPPFFGHHPPFPHHHRRPCKITSTSTSTTSTTSTTEPTSTSTTSTTEPTTTSTTSTTEPTSTTSTTEPTTSTSTSTASSTSTSTSTSTTTTTASPSGRRRRAIESTVSKTFKLGGPSGRPSIFPNIFNPLRDLTSSISDINLQNISAIPEISPPANLDSLPSLPGVRNNIERARNLTLQAIGGGMDLRSGIQEATNRALRSVNPAGALIDLISTILNTYYFVAANCPLWIVGSYILTEGCQLCCAIIDALKNASFEASANLTI